MAELTEAEISRLRPPQDIIAVTYSIAEARERIPELAQRSLGGICVKNSIRDPWELVGTGNAHMMDFMYEVADATKPDGTDIQLELRKKLPKTTNQQYEVTTVFSADSSMHFDGITWYSPSGNGDKNVSTVVYPFLQPEQYHGAGHHIALAGRYLIIIERLSEDEVERYQRLPPRPGNFEAYWTRPPAYFAKRGECVPMKVGDYIAMHQYPVIGQPAFLHGTAAASEGRVSVVFDPYPVGRYDDGLEYDPAAQGHKDYPGTDTVSEVTI